MRYVAHRIRTGLDDLRTRYGTCTCGRKMRSRADYVKHGARHAYWAGKAGKAMRRKMGKETDSLRRWARANLEHAGLVDRYGKRTEAWRTRPELPARPRLRDFREAQRHQADHQRADYHKTRAGHHDGHAARHKTRAAERTGPSAAWSQWRHQRHETAATRHRSRETARRSQWAEVPSRAAPAPRPAPAAAPKARTAPARSDPARTPPASRPSPHGRLAPAVRGRTRT